MADVYEIVLSLKGTSRKEWTSPDTYNREDAEQKVAEVREVQQAEDGWLNLGWISTSGANVIVAFVQRADAPRSATEDDENLSPEELVRSIIGTLEDIGLKVVRPDGSPWDADHGTTPTGSE